MGNVNMEYRNAMLRGEGAYCLFLNRSSSKGLKIQTKNCCIANRHEPQPSSDISLDLVTP